jgi:hypothetical protein
MKLPEWLLFSGSGNQYDYHHKLLVEKVIEILKEKPECFSARWFNGSSLDASVRSNDNQILIMIYDGQIVQPVNPQMSKRQKNMVKQLIQPIVKKDSDYLVDRLVRG